MTDYLEHTEIIDLITSMYTRMDKDGICCGFTSMWIQAVLAGKEAEQQFMNRLEFIHSRYRDVYGKISPDKLIYDIENLTKYRKEVSEQSSSLSDEENYDSEILDVMSFFDAISLQQSPFLYPELFLKSVDQGDKQTLYPLTYSKTIEDAGKAFEFNDVGPLAFTIDELTAYLASVKEVFTQTSEDGAIGFLLSSINHVIGLSYDKANNLWKVMDVNQPICVSDDDKVIANYISKAFFEKEYILTSVQAISLGNQSAAIKDLTELRNSAYQKKTIGLHKYKDSNHSTLLYLAIEYDNVESIKFLFKNGADPNQANHRGETPLSEACIFGYFDVVALLIANGADPNQPNNDGTTPLYIACQNGHSKVVELLLEKGANPNQADNDGATPLFIACQNGHSDVVALLLEKGANPNQANNNRFKPLFIACQNGHSDVVALLLKNGAEPNQATSNGVTPLFIACQNGHSDVVALLLEKGANPNQANNNRFKPLFIACQNGHSKVAALLLEKGANPNQASSNGTTPLYTACQNGHSDVVELLLEKGADPNQVNKNRFTPLHVACENGHSKVVALLLENGVDPNQVTNILFTPLYLACQNGHSDVVELLLEKGADPNQAKNDGTTPLYIACQNSHSDVVELLLEKGADPNQAKNDGTTPLYIACQNGHSKVVALLLEKGANPNQVTYNGITPLHVACGYGHSKVATLLLKKGANPNQVYANRFTPLYIACEKGSSELVVLLLKMGATPDKLTLDTYFKTYSDIFIKFSLHSAYTKGSVEDLKLLFSKGMVHNDYTDSKGHSPLYLASYYGNTEVVEFLIEHGADLNQTNKNGSTPLLVACQNGHIETVRLLLEENETELNLANKNGGTPLYWACKNGHVPIVKLLLKKGALSDLVYKALSENDSLDIADIPGIYDILSFAFKRKMDYMITKVRDIIPNDKRVQFEQFMDTIKHNKVTNAPKTSQPIRHGFNNLLSLKDNINSSNTPNDTRTPRSSASTPQNKSKP